jgi:multiple sugar transport system ATP-binding protein
MVGMVAIAVRALTKTYDGAPALNGVDLDVAPGELLVVLGPSGSGKSTLLRLIAGFDQPTSGEVFIDGVPVADLAARERNIAMVFQSYALYPHLTVAQNIGFPLRASGDDPGAVAARIAEAARLLGIVELLNRLPEHLSGGQRQRVALARALIRRPAVLLLDEPMSNVDAGGRAELRTEIVGLARRLAVTTVYVTHDQADALSIADRVAVLRDGVLQQVGEPASIYADPATLFVAAFLGTPRPSLLEAAIYADQGRVVLDLGSQVLDLPPADPRTAALAGHHTERVTVVLRALSAGAGLTGVVRRIQNLGHEVLAHVDVGGVPTPGLERVQKRPAVPSAHTEYGFYPNYEGVSLAPAGEVVVRLPAPTSVRVGDDLGAAVGLDELLLFDRAGKRIRL